MNYIMEHLETKVTQECDVLVAGGGIAGIAAALAAARTGAKVVMCEREYTLGGLATLGLITIYLPLCDGCGNQMSFGIAEELLRLSIKHGAQDRYPKAWLEDGSLEEKAKQRFEVQFNPCIFASLCEQLLTENGVKILFGTKVCAVEKENDKIKHVIIENKSGRSAICVRSVVDATGDADVCFISGEDTILNPKKNPLAAWYYGSGKKGVELNMRGYADVPDSSEDTEEIKPLESKKFTGVDAEELSRMMQLSRKHILKDMLERRNYDENLEVVTMPTIPQVRMSRRIKGKFELLPSHCETLFEDSIGVIGSWRKKDVRIEIPFSSLYGLKVKNLITAGRCISSVGDMWDLTRVIPCCAVTGQAAGIAAATCNNFDTIDIKKLQKNLQDAGAVLHIKDVMQ